MNLVEVLTQPTLTQLGGTPAAKPLGCRIASKNAKKLISNSGIAKGTRLIKKSKILLTKTLTKM